MLILASKSPRRSQLLSAAGFVFTVIPAEGKEIMPENAVPSRAVRALASQKAREVARNRENDIVIGADTVVVCGGKILGKPRDEADAFAMLSALSGRTHEVYTGVAVIGKGAELVFSEVTKVEFYRLSKAEIHAYIKTGESFDKAGSYGIQGKGMTLVRRVSGDFYNVMGLPVGRLSRVLKCLK